MYQEIEVGSRCVADMNTPMKRTSFESYRKKWKLIVKNVTGHRLQKQNDITTENTCLYARCAGYNRPSGWVSDCGRVSTLQKGCVRGVTPENASFVDMWRHY